MPQGLRGWNQWLQRHQARAPYQANLQGNPGGWQEYVLRRNQMRERDQHQRELQNLRSSYERSVRDLESEHANQFQRYMEDYNASRMDQGNGGESLRDHPFSMDNSSQYDGSLADGSLLGGSLMTLPQSKGLGAPSETSNLMRSVDQYSGRTSSLPPKNDLLRLLSQYQKRYHTDRSALVEQVKDLMKKSHINYVLHWGFEPEAQNLPYVKEKHDPLSVYKHKSYEDAFNAHFPDFYRNSEIGGEFFHKIGSYLDQLPNEETD